MTPRLSPSKPAHISEEYQRHETSTVHKSWDQAAYILNRARFIERVWGKYKINQLNLAFHNMLQRCMRYFEAPGTDTGEEREGGVG